MKNKMLFLKKFACAAGIVLLMTGGAHADLVFSEDFGTGTSLTTSWNGSSYAGAWEFGGATPKVAVGEWHSARTRISLASEALAYTSESNTNRSRGAAIWLDSSMWDVGTVTVTFDVSGYTAGTNDAESLFQAYAATGVSSTEHVSLDLHGAVSGGGLVTGSSSGATIATIGSQFNFSSNGTGLTATFDFTGQDNIALVFNNSSGSPTGGFMAAFSIDNIMVNTVPEPSTMSMFGLGIIGLLARRRRA